MAGTISKGTIVKSGGGNGGGGSSSFPIIVTDSGSSLPATTGFSVGDTFLDTSDKKIYTAGYFGYELNTNVTNYGSLTVDTTTGIASGFDTYDPSISGSAIRYIYRTGLNYGWYGNKTYTVHFKLTSNGTTDKKYVLLSADNTNSYEHKIIAIIVLNNKIYLDLAYKPYQGSSTFDTTLLLDYDLSLNTEYFLRITKTGTSAKIELFTGNYDETLLADNTITTSDWNYNETAGLFYYGFLVSIGGRPFQIGEIYLADSMGEFLKASSTLSWDSGTDITDKTEYADKTNGILYLYEDTELIQIPDIDLSNYKLKATTTTIDTASVTVSEIKANTNYVFSNNAITNITLSGCETSFEETTIEFTTGSTAPSVTDNSGITWMDNFDITNLSANKSYLIVIFNKLGFAKEY